MIRFFDFILSLVGLVVLAPIFIVLAIWIKIDSNGPVFYKQVRVGPVSYTHLDVYKRQEFKLGFNLRLDALKFTKLQIEESLTEAKKVQVENLTKALNIAKKAGITDFSKANTNSLSVPEYMLGEGRLNISDSKLADGTYLFVLGEKYLQAQLDLSLIHI